MSFGSSTGTVAGFRVGTTNPTGVAELDISQTTPKVRKRRKWLWVGWEEV